MKKLILLSALICSFILFVSCSNTEKVNIPNLNEKIFINDECDIIDWRSPGGFTFTDFLFGENFIKKFIKEAEMDAESRGQDFKKCIENQENARCFLLYVMYNHQTDLCIHFPEFVEIEYFAPPSMGSGLGGGIYNSTCKYREICQAFVKIFNKK